MRQSRGARLGLVALAVVAGVVACGGDDKSASNTTSTSSTTASSNTKDTGADQTAERERAALPAGGPVDEVNPPGDPAYEELAAGQCDELRRQVETWEAQGVADVEGSNAIELYRSAANACLHDWDAAIAAFDRLTSDFGGDCARRAVLAWLRPLIEARRADASFDRDFRTGRWWRGEPVSAGDRGRHVDHRRHRDRRHVDRRHRNRRHVDRRHRNRRHVDDGDHDPLMTSVPDGVGTSVPARSMFATMRGLATVVAPTTLVTALLFYFGGRARAPRPDVMGLDDSLFGYSTRDYILRSVTTMFWPLFDNRAGGGRRPSLPCLVERVVGRRRLTASRPR